MKRREWPIRFEKLPMPHRQPLPFPVGLAVIALVATILFNCGFKGV